MFERKQRENAESQFDSMRKVHQEELAAVKEGQKVGQLNAHKGRNGRKIKNRKEIVVVLNY